MKPHGGSRGRVAIVRHGTYPEQPHLLRDVRALQSAGFHVTVVCDSQPGLTHYEQLDGVTVVRVPLQHKRGGIVRYLFEYAAMPVLSGLALAVLSLMQRYDYVEVDTMPDWLVVSALVPRLLGAKVILYMFENMSELLASDRGLTHTHPVVRLLDGIELICARWADRVLTPYEKARRRLVQKGIAPEKVLFIPNGPDEDIFLRNVDGATQTGGGSGFRLVTHGSLLERYGIQTLLEAMAIAAPSVPDLTLDVIGSGEFEPALRALAQKLGLSDSVHFIGPVAFEEMAGHLLKADVGVVPYWLDGMPNKLMEYLLLRIPAVVSDFPTVREYLDDEAIRYVPARHAQALAGAITDLYRNPAQRERQAEAAFRQYTERLAWRTGTLEYLAVYDASPRQGGDVDTSGDGPSSTSWLSFVLRQSRGPRNAMHRLPTIISRFGVSAGKSRRQLERLTSILDRHGVRATLPVTAVTARRNPEVLHWLRDRGVEIAAHGFVHNDFSAVTSRRQWEDVFRARDELAALGLPVRGWRCPYSRWNADTLLALKASGFDYDATPVYAWPAFDAEGIEMTPAERADYERVCSLFGVRDASRSAVLPQEIDGLVQIPMSIPQDEDMVDRLGLSQDQMTRVWLRVLHDSRELRELFVICLHPERVEICSEALDATLREATSLSDVWVPTLGEISDWWRARSQATIEVSPNGGNGSWQVRVAALASASLMLGDRKLPTSGRVTIEATEKPVVTFGPQWPQEALDRVRGAGYIVERDSDGRGVDPATFASPNDDPGTIIRMLNQHQDRLLRLQPWPSGYRSCLAVSGDIDALTLFDFAMRLKEFS